MQQLEEQLVEKFKKKELKDTTIHVYISSIKRVIKEVFDGKLPELNDKEVQKEIIKYLYSDKVTMSSKKTIMNGLINCYTILKYDTSLLEEEFKKIIRITSEERVYAKPTENELKHKKSLKKIILRRDVYKNLLKMEFKKEDLYYLLLCLYTYLPPLRGQDYYNTLLLYDCDELKEKNKDNYLCLNEKKIVLNDHKTVKIYGARSFELPNELIEVLTDFKKKSNSKWVICSTKGTKLDHGNFYKLMTSAFGEKISSSMMRKIYISEEIIDKKITADERKKISYIMGHSVEQQELTYSKFSKNLHPTINNDDSD